MLLDEEEFLVVASSVKEPAVFTPAKWNLKRDNICLDEKDIIEDGNVENDQELNAEYAALTKQQKVPKRMTKQQIVFCSTLVRVLIAAENRGDVVDSKQIVLDNFNRKCSKKIVQLFDDWRKLQPDVIRTYKSVKMRGNEVKFKTFNSGTCKRSSLGAFYSLLIPNGEGSQELRETPAGTFICISTKSNFLWHLNRTSEKMDHWSVEHRIVEIQAVDIVVAPVPAPSVITLDSTPLLFCNGCNANDMNFLRHLFLKFFSPDMRINHFSNGKMGRETFEAFLEDERMGSAIPDHIHRLISQSWSHENELTFKTMFEGTHIGQVAERSSVDCGDGEVGKSCGDVVKMVILMEVLLEVDQSNNLILNAVVREVHSTTTVDV